LRFNQNLLMEDCRVAWLRARANVHRVEAARLDAEAETVLAVRAARVSPWGSELSPLVMQQLFTHLQWDEHACAAMRATCSTWCSMHDAMRPGWLRPRRSLAVMQGKLGWFQSVTTVDLTRCEGGVSGVLAELGSMPSLRSLTLPASCAESAMDAEVVYGLTTLTTLRFHPVDDDEGVEEAGEWVLDLSRLPSLTTLNLRNCSAVTDVEVLALSNATGLTTLNLNGCENMTSEGLRAVSSLTALSTLILSECTNVTDEGLQTLSSLTALYTLHLFGCPNLTDAGKQALLTAIPNLTIRD
jgi:hypothetical protein